MFYFNFWPIKITKKCKTHNYLDGKLKQGRRVILVEELLHEIALTKRPRRVLILLRVTAAARVSLGSDSPIIDDDPGQEEGDTVEKEEDDAYAAVDAEGAQSR